MISFWVEGKDYYYDEEGTLILTEQYLKERGWCCRCECRHCPYKKKESND